MFVGDALLDLGILGLHPGIVLIATCMEPCQGTQAFFWTVVIDEPTRRLGGLAEIAVKEEHRRYLREEGNQQAQQDRRNDLNSQRHLPLGIVGRVETNIRAVGDPRGAEGSHAQHKLLQSCDSATDLGVADLGLVERDDHGEEADSA